MVAPLGPFAQGLSRKRLWRRNVGRPVAPPCGLPLRLTEPLRGNVQAGGQRCRYASDPRPTRPGSRQHSVAEPSMARGRDQDAGSCGDGSEMRGRRQTVTVMYWHRRLRVPASTLTELRTIPSPSGTLDGLFALAARPTPAAHAIGARSPNSSGASSALPARARRRLSSNRAGRDARRPVRGSLEEALCWRFGRRAVSCAGRAGWKVRFAPRCA